MSGSLTVTPSAVFVDATPPRGGECIAPQDSNKKLVYIGERNIVCRFADSVGKIPIIGSSVVGATRLVFSLLAALFGTFLAKPIYRMMGNDEETVQKLYDRLNNRLFGEVIRGLVEIFTLGILPRYIDSDFRTREESDGSISCPEYYANGNHMYASESGDIYYSINHIQNEIVEELGMFRSKRGIIQNSAQIVDGD